MENQGFDTQLKPSPVS